MREIHLTKGQIALVSDEDYERMAAFRWYAVRHGRTMYAVRHVRTPDGRYLLLLMHRSILEVSAGQVIDHIDGDGLNNQRDNLRLCSHTENVWNSRLRVTNRTGYQGVWFNPKKRRWQATISLRGRRVYLGMYRTVEAAGAAYIAAAEKYRGEFASDGTTQTVIDVSGRWQRPIGRSGYRGVFQDGQRFQAHYRRKYLGVYSSAKEAAEARDRAALADLGPLTVLNFPSQIDLEKLERVGD